MNMETMRHKLPLLAVGQAQKEYTHNEALTLIDNYLNISVRDVINDPTSLSPDADNDMWLIGTGPVGLWSGKANQIAIWSENGWRYLYPIEQMQLYNEAINCRMTYGDGQWISALPMLVPQNGDIIDLQARESIEAIWDALHLFGWSRR